MKSIEVPIWEMSETSPPPSPTIPEPLESNVPALLTPQPIGILGKVTEEPERNIN